MKTTIRTLKQIDPIWLYIEIGKRVKRYREQAGLSQEELAMNIGQLRTSVTNIEAGKQRCPIYIIYNIALSLGCKVSDLLPEVL
jgi:DNA-binding XRE family transcriptional regulator